MISVVSASVYLLWLRMLYLSTASQMRVELRGRTQLVTRAKAQLSPRCTNGIESLTSSEHPTKSTRKAELAKMRKRETFCVKTSYGSS